MALEDDIHNGTLNVENYQRGSHRFPINNQDRENDGIELARNGVQVVEEEIGKVYRGRVG